MDDDGALFGLALLLALIYFFGMWMLTWRRLRRERTAHRALCDAFREFQMVTYSKYRPIPDLDAEIGRYEARLAALRSDYAALQQAVAQLQGGGGVDPGPRDDRTR